MPRQALPLECSKEDKTRLIAIRKSRAENPRIVERAKIVLARVAGKEICQVAHDLKVSVPTVTKWCKRFSLRGLRGLLDDPRPGKPPKYDASFRDQVLSLLSTIAAGGDVRLGSAGTGGAAWIELGCRLACPARRRHLSRRRRTWRAVTDIALVPKCADVIGLIWIRH